MFFLRICSLLSKRCCTLVTFHLKFAISHLAEIRNLCHIFFLLSSVSLLLHYNLTVLFKNKIQNKQKDMIGKVYGVELSLSSCFLLNFTPVCHRCWYDATTLSPLHSHHKVCNPANFHKYTNPDPEEIKEIAQLPMFHKRSVQDILNEWTPS